MHLQHEVLRLGRDLVEDHFENVDDELHGGEVVVVEDDFPEPGFLGLRLLFGDDGGVALFARLARRHC